MRPSILLPAFTVLFFTSCTTAYKTGQTPDDVYYSPVRPQEEYVKTDNEEKKENQYSDEYRDDRYLHMKVRDHYRWSDLDDSYYYSRRYNYSSYNCCCFGNPWTPYSYWNNYYNPYSYNHTVISPAAMTTYNKPRTVNLNAYNTNALTNSDYSNPKYSSSGNSSSGSSRYSAPRNSSSTRNNNNNSGNILRDIFKGSNSSSSSSSSSNNSSNSSSSNSSSSSSSSSSSGSSGSSAPVRKF